MKLKSNKAAGLIEYTVLAGFISIATIGLVYNFGSQTQKVYGNADVTLAAQRADIITPNSANDLDDENTEPVYDTVESPQIDRNDPDFEVTFTFPQTNIGIYDSRTRIKSSYENLPFSNEDYGTWYNFTVWSQDGNGTPTATHHIESGQETDEGRVRWGTMLEVDIPDRGETQTVFLNVGGKIGEWTLSREDFPDIEPFGFPDTHVAWDDVHARISSDYLDITGLTTEPLPFTVVSNDGNGNPLATHHVVGGRSAASGELTNGTILEMDIPAPGETRILTLNVAGVEGTWRVEREDVPSTPQLTLSSNNGHNFAQIRYSSNGAANIPRPFSISGTGNTNPRLTNISSGTGVSGYTASWGSNISITVPQSSRDVETITLNIDGQIITWTVSGY